MNKQGAIMSNFETAEPAFEDVFRDNFTTIAQFAERRGAYQAGEDVAQEVMARMWRAKSFDPHRATPWLMVVAKNLVIDGHRAAQARPQQIPQEEASEIPCNASDHTEQIHIRTLAEQALRYMSAEQREVVELVLMQGYGVAEVAEKLSIPQGTVKSRQFYGLRAAKTALQGLGIHSAE